MIAEIVALFNTADTGLIDVMKDGAIDVLTAIVVVIGGLLVFRFGYKWVRKAFSK